MPEVERREPLYLQVVRHYRDQISSGQLRDGELMPPVRQIARDWDISVPTAAKVITTLKTEGLVETKSGAGTTVRAAARRSSATQHVDRIIKTGRIYPEGNYARILAAEVVEAPDHIAEVFDIEPGTPVIRRKRTVYSPEDQPLSTSTSWFDTSLSDQAPLLLSDERIKQRSIRYILVMTGRANHGLQVVTENAADDAGPHEAAELQIAEGESISRARNWFRDDNGGLVEYGESAYRKLIWARQESYSAPKEHE